MLSQKKKISKKEIKEDKLVTFMYKATKYVNDQKKNLMIGAGVVAVLVLAVVYFFYQRNINNEKAGLELSRVVPIYDMGNYSDAIKGRADAKAIGLKKIVDLYGSSENGQTAKVYLANAYFMLGNLDEAYKEYDDYGGSNEMYKASALAGVAGYFESKREFEKAAEKYLDAAHVSKTNTQNPDYLLRAGINYLGCDKKDKAKELFEKIQDEYSTSPAVRELNRYMARVED